MDKIAGKTGPCRIPIQQTSNTWKNITVDRLKGCRSRRDHHMQSTCVCSLPIQQRVKAKIQVKSRDLRKRPCIQSVHLSAIHIHITPMAQITNARKYVHAEESMERNSMEYNRALRICTCVRPTQQPSNRLVKLSVDGFNQQSLAKPNKQQLRAWMRPEV